MKTTVEPKTLDSSALLHHMMSTMQTEGVGRWESLAEDTLSSCEFSSDRTHKDTQNMLTTTSFSHQLLQQQE